VPRFNTFPDLEVAKGCEISLKRTKAPERDRCLPDYLLNFHNYVGHDPLRKVHRPSFCKTAMDSPCHLLAVDTSSVRRLFRTAK